MVGGAGSLVNKGSNAEYSWGAAITCRIRVSWQMATAKGVHGLLSCSLANEANATYVILSPQFTHTDSNTGDTTRCHSSWGEPWKTFRWRPLLLKIQKSKEVELDSTLCKPGDHQLGLFWFPQEMETQLFSSPIQLCRSTKCLLSHQRLSNCQWYNLTSYWDLSQSPKAMLLYCMGSSLQRRACL